MSVPKYDEFMLPILETLSDGTQRSRKELSVLAADRLGISEEERAELLPSGRVLLYQNRSAWAVTYLFKAKLLDRVRAGQYQISARGLSVLQKKPAKIDISFLKQFPEFLSFYLGAEEDEVGDFPREDLKATTSSERLTPQDQLDQALTELRRDLSQEYLERIMRTPPPSSRPWSSNCL